MSGARFPLFKKLLNLGNNPDTPFIESSKNLMFNLFLMVATPFALLVFIINLVSQEYILALFNALQLIIFGIGFWVSATQKKLYLRAYFLLINAIIGIITAYLFKNGSEYRLLIMMVAAVVILDKKWHYALFSLILSLSFVAIRLDDMLLSTLSFINIFISIIKILLPLIFFLLCLFYFKHLYFENQQKLEKAYKDLSSSKNEKERILNVVAHDLRTPISGIAGISKLVLHDPGISVENKELLHLIEEASDSSLKMIKELMSSNVIQIEKNHFNFVEMNKYIQQSLKLLEFSAKEKSIKLIAEYLPSPIFVSIEPDQMDRVIANLVANAIKFSTPNSNIKITLQADNSFFTLIIEDEGIGIPKENHDSVFDMFTAAKRKGTAGEKSFGLGLSICKQIVEMHSGNISFTSETGKGTCFFVKLPLRG